MIVYTCTDDFESMMTCIYEAWASKEGHKNIKLLLEPIGNLELFCEYRHVEPDSQKAQKVVHSIRQKISARAYQMIFRCAMSTHPDKLDMIYRFLLLGFAYPKDIMHMLQHPYVMAVFEQNRAVINETHQYREFARFQAAPGGILVATIEPNADILTLLAPAFEDRLPSENWMILDANRHTAAVHPADELTYFTSLSAREQTELLEAAKSADPYRELWKGFFQQISIEQRTNPACQRTHLPLHYRKYMPEFSD